MTPNWFVDGQHILALAGGTVIFSAQVINFWRQNVTTKRVDALHRVVADNDAEILDELSSAQKALNHVVATIASSDRRRAPAGPPPIFANGGAGRRSTDAPAP